MQFLLDKIIYLYLFISLALLVFNILYILRGERIEKHKKKGTFRGRKNSVLLHFPKRIGKCRKSTLGG